MSKQKVSIPRWMQTLGISEEVTNVIRDRDRIRRIWIDEERLFASGQKQFFYMSVRWISWTKCEYDVRVSNNPYGALSHLSDVKEKTFWLTDEEAKECNGRIPIKEMVNVG